MIYCIVVVDSKHTPPCSVHTYQGVSRIRNQTSGVGSLRENKDKSAYKHWSGNYLFRR